MQSSVRWLHFLVEAIKQNTKKKKFVIILSISILLLIVFSLLLYFYTDYPQRFPKWFSTYIPIITGAAIVIPILGTLLSDIIIPIWDRLTEQDAGDVAWLSNKAPIRKVSYSDIIGRLGRGGKIPWVDRGILSRRTLRLQGSVAIVGWMKSGKTREAAELIRTAVEMNLASVIYEPTSALDLIDTNSLEAAVRAEIDESQKAIFFIDELGLRPEPERLSRLSTCIDTIKKVRPDTFFLITIQHERLTPVFEAWLEQQNFYRVSLPPLTDDQRENLVLTGASELGVHLTDDAVDVLVNKTDGRPYSILFTLQQAQSSEQLSKDQVNRMLEQTDEEAWGEQRRNIIISIPIAEYLLTSIVHFSSAGVTPLERSIHRYAKYLVEKEQQKNISVRFLPQAQNKWALFDIVASKGIYTIPEPLLLPLIIKVEDARSYLVAFAENYNPGWFARMIQTFLSLFDSLAKIQFKLPKQKLLVDVWKRLKKYASPPLSSFFLRIRRIFRNLLPLRKIK